MDDLEKLIDCLDRARSSGPNVAPDEVQGVFNDYVLEIVRAIYERLRTLESAVSVNNG